ncbi:aminotransferase class V-fold PLP-dependent enzyme [Cohnella sp. CFH 77786]|uniref:cysteine desulfurase family protein n=1 Tax=Cohnella sp. CFH 77786 TaxID=2662265 RepID=UPI001C60B5E9|nr:cysteine desulfurase family protein [Cohnella sp. CFH 77786]MBW5444861.1 aminotransferase class V-fold PLP-dependent enzyme [Cohnella sp. CFH 77786]
MNTLYFDHCASAPLHRQVAETVYEVMKLHYANAAALHRAGKEALKLVDRARLGLAAGLGVKPGEIVLTSGGTESNNLALKGIWGRRGRPAKHLITTTVEHASVYRCAKQLEGTGVDVTWLQVDEFGRVRIEDVVAAIRPDTVLVSVMHVNNETGTVQPIREIGAALARFPHVRFHVDGVQAIGKVPVCLREWGIDMYSGSAHKFQGPKGAGFLFVREGLQLEPLLAGGSQEEGVRGGTHNVPGIVGMAQAFRLSTESAEERRNRMFALRRRLLAIAADIPELVLNGYGAAEEERTAPHVVNLSYPGMRPEVLVHMLEEHGVLVSTQSACSSKSLQPSRVLRAMGLGDDRATGSIRISFGDEHTEQDIDALGERLRLTVRKLKPLERSRA